MSFQKRNPTFEHKDVVKFLIDRQHNKAERYLYLSLWVLKLEVNYPGLKWKTTDLAKQTDISRSWIYEFFGQNRKQIYDHALKVVAEDIYGRSDARQEIKAKFGMLGSLFRSRYIIQFFPEILVFYYRCMSDEGDQASKFFRQEERDFLAKTQVDTGLSGTELLNYRASIHGLMTATFLDDVEVEECLRVLLPRS